METHTLQRIMEEWTEIIPKMDIIPRLQAPELTTRKANAIFGLRRSGKTYLSFQMAQELRNVAYINLEDERVPKQTEILTSLIPAASSLLEGKKFWIIVDEIQSIPQWERWVNRVVESKEVNLIITGSTQRLSRTGLPKAVQGRVRSFRLFPLSFIEFLRFNEFTLSKTQVGTGKILAMFEEYMKFGGMPSIVLERSNNEKLQEARDLFDVIILRNIIEQFNVKNPRVIKDMIAIAANSKLVSISQMYKNLCGIGHRVGKSTVAEYLSYPESVFFYEQVKIYGKSVKSEIQYPRKMYLADNIFYKILSTRLNNSWLLESLVFWELRRKFPNLEVRYWRSKDGLEVDFVLLKRNRIHSLIQVAHSIEDESTLMREKKALVKASRETGCNRLQILTWNEEQDIEHEGKRIGIRSVWRWMLSELMGVKE